MWNRHKPHQAGNQVIRLHLLQSVMPVICRILITLPTRYFF
jgi:hypothetical protein